MMKKMLIVLAAAALLLCGCGRNGRTGATLEVDLTHSYVSEPFTMQGMDVFPIAAMDGSAIVNRTKNQGKSDIYLYNTVENTYSKIEKSLEGSPAYATQLPDGRLAAVFNVPVGRKGGMDEFDGKDRILEIYGSDLKPEEVLHFPSDVPEQLLNEYCFTMDSDGYWYLFTYDQDGFSSVCILNPDLTVKGTIDVESIACDCLAVGKSGKVYALAGVTDGYASHVLYGFDAQTMTGEQLSDFAVPVDVRGIMDGSVCELYYYNEKGIYGVNEDGTSQLVVDYVNSDILEDVWNGYSLKDGTFVIRCPFVGGNGAYYQFRPRTEEEIENTQVISLAGVRLGESLKQDVCAYNQSQQEYRIVIKDYEDDVSESDYGTQYEEALDLFKDDLLSGIVPDIICMDELPYQQLSNKGLLTDLAPMLENDERFDPSLYHMNILDGMKKGEKLERIGFSFSFTAVAAKTELVGEQQGRTPAEYVEMIQSMPEDMQLLPFLTRDDIVYYYLIKSQSAFIDKGTMTSSFATESFVQLMEFAGSLQSFEEMYPNGYDYSDYEEQYNKALLNTFEVSQPIFYHDAHASSFKMEDMTLVGFPDSSGGNGGRYRMTYSLALTSRSDKIDATWEFIMEQLSSIRQSLRCSGSRYKYGSMPVMREPLTNCLFAATRGACRPYGNANEQEMSVLEAYIEGMRMYDEQDSFISNIIYEETYMYFSGDQTAERAAEMIQKRVDLYLSEQE